MNLLAHARQKTQEDCSMLEFDFKYRETPQRTDVTSKTKANPTRMDARPSNQDNAANPKPQLGAQDQTSLYCELVLYIFKIHALEAQAREEKSSEGFGGSRQRP
ncbi:hypothetical protein CCUS01_14553 [Colletotrichum cuscutae]|uniref:Uncharacterized protein n=1 Tax=Colletotrichum cuscutae TaxID=1209917 RepID=A0AAI9Y8U5_9PEZI|nr:hypothetical protein CCUS01_14553 [Colletotrichum cuscutae]